MSTRCFVPQKAGQFGTQHSESIQAAPSIPEPAFESLLRVIRNNARQRSDYRAHLKRYQDSAFGGKIPVLCDSALNFYKSRPH